MVLDALPGALRPALLPLSGGGGADARARGHHILCAQAHPAAARGEALEEMPGKGARSGAAGGLAESFEEVGLASLKGLEALIHERPDVAHAE